MQVVGKISESYAVMFNDVGKAPVNFVGFIFGTEINGRSGLGQSAKPIARRDVGDGQLQGDQGFANRTFAGK